MTEPSKERIAAALALAEATAEWANIQEPASGENRVRCWIERMQPALTAYRATAPKLRTRAEVDAEIVAQVRDYFGGGPKSSGALGEQYELIQELCREDTAPEANGITDHDADTSPCVCEESVKLRERIWKVRNIIRSSASISTGLVHQLDGVLDGEA